jgi:hypothetical protein
MGTENRVEDMYKKGYRSLRKIFKSRDWDTFRARNRAEFKAPGGFMILFVVGLLWLAGTGLEVQL